MENLICVMVGEKYPDWNAKLTQRFQSGESGAFLYYDSEKGSLDLFIMLNKPTSKEKQNVKKELPRFRVFNHPSKELSWITVSFGLETVFDMGYNPYPDADKFNPKMVGNMFNVFGIDSRNAEVFAVRTFGLSKNAVNIFNELIRVKDGQTLADYLEWQKHIFTIPLLPLFQMSTPFDWDK